MENTNKIDGSNIKSPSVGGVGEASSYIDLYKAHHENIKKHSAPVLNDLREL